MAAHRASPPACQPPPAPMWVAPQPTPLPPVQGGGHQGSPVPHRRPPASAAAGSCCHGRAGRHVAAPAAAVAVALSRWCRPRWQLLRRLWGWGRCPCQCQCSRRWCPRSSARCACRPSATLRARPAGTRSAGNASRRGAARSPSARCAAPPCGTTSSCACTTATAEGAGRKGPGRFNVEARECELRREGSRVHGMKDPPRLNLSTTCPPPVGLLKLLGTGRPHKVGDWPDLPARQMVQGTMIITAQSASSERR